MSKASRNKSKKFNSYDEELAKKSGFSKWWSELPTSSQWGVGILTGVVGLGAIATFGYYGVPALLGMSGGVVAVAKQSSKNCVPSSNPMDGSFQTRPHLFFMESKSFDSCGNEFRHGLSCNGRTEIKTKPAMVKELREALRDTGVVFEVAHCKDGGFSVNILHKIGTSEKKRMQIMEQVCKATAMKYKVGVERDQCDASAGDRNANTNLRIYMGTMQREKSKGVPYVLPNDHFCGPNGERPEHKYHSNDQCTEENNRDITINGGMKYHAAFETEQPKIT